MGFFYGLNSEAYDRNYSDRELITRILRYFKPYRGRVILVILVVNFAALVGALNPILVARALDGIIKAPGARAILLLTLIVLGLGIADWAANYARRRMTAYLSGEVISALRRDAFTAALNHDLSFFDEFRSGRIISRITSDTEEFAQVTQILTEVVSQVLMFLILFVILMRTSWRLTLLLLATMPVVFLFAWGMRSLARKVTRRGFRIIAEVNATIQEAVSGIRVAKNFRQEARLYGEFSRVNQQSFRVNLIRGFTLALTFPLFNALSGMGTAMVVYWGGLTVAAGTISLGEWYLFINSVHYFWSPMLNLSSFWSQIQGGLSAAERIFALIDAEPTVRQLAQLPAPPLRGDIRFEHVSFRYTNQEEVLRDFNLHIHAGESVAFVGHTGAGKTSLARLIARFYEFQEGRITVDGYDIRNFDLHSYRQQLGIVSQTPFLFAGTIADNIRYARPDLSQEELEALAYRIGGGEWLASLPEGLNTEVGERGSRLSLGQRQLIALLRVLAQKPAIFILDEATASIDPFTEMQIQQAIELLLKQSTSILVAHRLSTVRAVDRIIVLDHGRIIEEGHHEQLLQAGGHYALLYNTYFRHQSLEYVEQVGARRREQAGA